MGPDHALDELDDTVWRLKGLALEESTKKSYATHRASYVSFCTRFGFSLTPISQLQATRYVASLSQRLSVASIKKYLNIIRIIHLEQGLPDPHVLQMYDVQNILIGLSKEKGVATKRMAPLTPTILSKMLPFLDLSKVDDASVWAACLLGFFGLLRRSNLFPPSHNGFNGSKHLSKHAISVSDSLLSVSLFWTKTLQFREKVLQVTLVAAPGCNLCPVTAMRHLLDLTKGVPASSPVFWRIGKGGLTPITYGWFTNRFRNLLSLCGEDPTIFGTHSLRRGGATWAFRCGLSAEAIQLLGHWRSEAYKSYIDLEPEIRVQYMRQLMEPLTT